MKPSLIERIQEVKLRGEHQKIAQFIIQNINKATFLLGPELAKQCSVSVSSVTRFAQKIGYSGFPEFKKALQAYYQATITPYEAFEEFTNKNVPKDSITKISALGDMENIKKTQETLDINKINETITLMKNAPVIHLAAIASAEILVDMMERYLMALDKKCNTLKSFGISKIIEVTDIAPDDILIGFAFQRIFKEMVEIFQYAKKMKIKTVIITDNPLNPIAMEADITLLAFIQGATFGLSLVAPLALVNILSNGYAAFDKKDSLEKLVKVKEDWEKYPIFCN